VGNFKAADGIALNRWIQSVTLCIRTPNITVQWRKRGREFFVRTAKPVAEGSAFSSDCRASDRQDFSCVHRILQKVAHSPNRDLKDRRDATTIWRTIYWKWLSAVHLPVSEGCPIDLVLAGCKCGESLTTLVCTPLTLKLPRIYKWWHCTCRVLPLALRNPAAPQENFIHRLSYVQQKRNDIHGIHTPGYSAILMHPRKQVFRAPFLLKFCEVLLEAKCHRAVDIRKLPPFPGRWATSAVRCSFTHQARAVSAARWSPPPPSFCEAGNCIFQSTFSKYLDWAALIT
jgi:hypothetical protein